MVKINIFCIGKIKEQYIKDAINEYSKRLSKFCKLEIIELNEEIIQNSNEEKVKEVESKRILSKLSNKDYLILLDLHGKEFTSEEMALNISSLIDKGINPINIAIGGTLGFSKEIVDRANLRICFSKMTFPHQLIRVFLLEQLYRSFKIINNEAYHH